MPRKTTDSCKCKAGVVEDPRQCLGGLRLLPGFIMCLLLRRYTEKIKQQLLAYNHKFENQEKECMLFVISQNNNCINVSIKSATDMWWAPKHYYYYFADESVEDKGQSWAWGQFPNVSQTNSPVTETSNLELIDQEQQSMLTSMFSFMKQTKQLRHSGTEGIYLADINSVDPAEAALYFSTNRKQVTGTINLIALHFLVYNSFF